jgi:hypothetical protein
MNVTVPRVLPVGAGEMVTLSVTLCPNVAVLGEAVRVSVGTGLLMVTVWTDEVPPPGVALTTVTDALPAVATSEAGTVAVNEAALTNVVASAVPFQFTTEPPTKLVPVSVSVKLVPPAVAEVGEIKVRVGDGLFAVKV